MKKSVTTLNNFKIPAPTSSMWPSDGRHRPRYPSKGPRWRACVRRGTRRRAFRPAAATGPTTGRATTGSDRAGVRPKCPFIGSWRRSTRTEWRESDVPSTTPSSRRPASSAWSCTAPARRKPPSR
uniref:(northern house mosquito) hypothetical protein n=1 Tax=Culex pipiens TaxID=7175 RepID=A0A8D8FL62_CULPI